MVPMKECERGAKCSRAKARAVEEKEKGKRK